MASVSYAEYLAESSKEDEGKKPRQVWRRIPRAPVSVQVPLNAKTIAAGISLPDTSGLYLRGKLGRAEGYGLPDGTLALSLFIINERTPGERGRRDEPFIFQVRLELSFAAGFVPRPNLRDEASSDWDDRVADLQFRNRFEYGVGHGVSVEVPAQRPQNCSPKLQSESSRQMRRGGRNAGPRDFGQLHVQRTAA